jgi:hypothetical protein
MDGGFPIQCFLFILTRNLVVFIGKVKKMMSPRPWSIDENDPSIIYDADGFVIATNYTFLHVDDFERLCKIVNANDTIKRKQNEK